MHYNGLPSPDKKSYTILWRPSITTAVASFDFFFQVAVNQSVICKAEVQGTREKYLLAFRTYKDVL